MSYTELQDLLDGLDDPDPSVRLVTILQAADLAQDHSIVFARAAADPDASVRLEAVRALEGESAAPAVNALVDRLDDEDEDVAEAAATSLAEILDPIAAPVLLARLSARWVLPTMTA